jgi:D-alanyl-lipoteichoic acid acyltransferase DltB (MBOAT superfamily)
LFELLTFVSFFPATLAGPIERARNFLPQLQHRRVFELASFYRASWLMGLGLFEKFFLGDHCAHIAHKLLDSPAKTSVLGTLLGMYAYAFHLYADFAGYSNMARGCARVLGFELMENFSAPYLSVSLAGFWRRWHISLSSFLDDYVYRPSSMVLRNLGDSGIVIATFATFFVSAIWHGTGLQFVAWGALHASVLSILVLTRRRRKRLSKKLPNKLWSALGIACTFHVVCLGYVFFRAPSLAAAGELFATLSRAPLWHDAVGRRVAPLVCLIVVTLGLDLMKLHAKGHEWVFTRPVWLRALCYVAILVCLLRFRAPVEQFAYLQF